MQPTFLRTAGGLLVLAIERRIDAGWHPDLDVNTSVRSFAADIDTDAFRTLDNRFTAIARTLRLDTTAARIAAAAALSHIHPAAATLIGALGGHGHADTPNVALVLEIAGLGTSDPAGWAALAPTSDLIRARIITVQTGSLTLQRQVTIHETIIRRLHADHTASALIAPFLTHIYPITDEPEISHGAAAVTSGIPLVWIHAPVGAAGASWAAGMCQLSGQYPIAVDVTSMAFDDVTTDMSATSVSIPRRQWDEEHLRTFATDLVLEARLDDCPLVIIGAENLHPVLPYLWQAPVTVLAVASRQWDARWYNEVPLELVARRLTSAQRATTWQQALGSADIDRQISVLRMTPEHIHTVGRAVHRITAATGLRPNSELVTQLAHSVSARAHSRPRAGRTRATLSDLVLPDHALGEIQRLVSWGRYRDDVLATSQLQGKGGKGSGIAALFSGSPGTGKTLAAHVVADALGMELMQIDLSSIVDKYIGETEKNLERAFSAAESMNCVLFFDEADSLFGARSAVNDSRDRYANQEVAYLLQRIEAFDGITVMATNLRGNIDTAFARRLHFMVHFPDPDEPTRLRLWQHHLDQVPELSQTDPPRPDQLARALEIAGGDIRNIVLAAAYDAISGGEPLSMGHLAAASLREFTKLGRRLPHELLA